MQLAGQNSEDILHGIFTGTHFQKSKEFSEICLSGPNSKDFSLLIGLSPGQISNEALLRLRTFSTKLQTFKTSKEFWIY